MEQKKTRVRGFAVLAVAAAVLAAALFSPVSAAFNATKPKVKKISAKQANKVVDAENAIVTKDFPDQNPGPGTSGFDLDATTTIASLTLPAGNWAVHADFNIGRNGSGVVVICDLLLGGTKVDNTNSFETDSQSVETVSLQAAAALPNGGTVEVRCDDGVAGGSGNSSEGNIDIIAIEGSSLA